MGNLLIQATKRTPLVRVDMATGMMEMKGNSIPEDPSEFFQKVEKAIDEYVKDPADKTIANIRLGIFNTSTSKWLLYLFMRLREFAQNSGKDVEINWFYEKDDEDALEAGESYQAVLKLPFHLIQVEGEDE